MYSEILLFGNPLGVYKTIQDYPITNYYWKLERNIITKALQSFVYSASASEKNC